MSSVPARYAGWLATMPTGRPPSRAKPTTMLLRVVLVHLEEVAVVRDRVDQVQHVVRLVRRRRHQRVERVVFAIERIVGRLARRIVEVVVGHERQQLANQRDALGVVLDGEVRDAALLVVRHRAAEVFLGDVFVRDGLDHVGTGDEHVARLLHHDDEVGDRRRVDGAAGARAHDRGDLRHHAGGQRVAQEDVGVAAERDDAFLDARAAGIVQADDRRAVAHRHVHDLADLRGVGFGERAAEDGEVLREGVDDAAVDAAVAADDAVAGDDLLLHPEVVAAMRDQLVDFFERAGIEQPRHALARGQLALRRAASCSRSSPPPSSASRSRSLSRSIGSISRRRRDCDSVPTPSTLTIMRSPGVSGPTPDGVPVVITSPGFERHEARDVLDQIRHREDQLAGVGVVAPLAVDPALDVELRRIEADRDARADRRRTCRSPWRANTARPWPAARAR